MSLELPESQQVTNRSAVLVPLWRKSQYSLSQICHHAAVLKDLRFSQGRLYYNPSLKVT